MPKKRNILRNYKYARYIARYILRKIGEKDDKYLVQQIINSFNKCEGDDFERIYDSIKHLYEKGITVQDWKSEFKEKKNYKVQTLVSFLTKFSIEVQNGYMDYGCGDGALTKIIGEELSLPIDKVYCAEIYHHESLAVDHIALVSPKDNKIDASDSAFDLITAYVVLHHVQNIPAMIREVVRVLATGGIFFIYEHDSDNHAHGAMLDLVHAVYHMVGTENEYQGITAKERFNSFPRDIMLREARMIPQGTRYFGKDQLADMLYKEGLHRVWQESTPNAQGLYFAAFKKNN